VAGQPTEGDGFSRRRDQLARATELLARAKRPVILAGHGILTSGAVAEVRALAETAHVPVAMTLLGIGAVPAHHPLNLGMMGMHGEAWVNDAIQEADLLMALGMRFDDRVTGKLASYAPLARKIHIDIDPSELHKNVRADVAVAGDLKAVLRAWLPLVCAARHDAWIARIGELAGGATVRDIAELPDNGRLCAAHVIHDIWTATAGRAIVVTDVGQHQMWTAQYYKVAEPGTFITSGGLGTMGFGLPAAIGAKLARPDREVWAIVGDGGFQMTQAELQTIVQENVKVNVAIINNGYLGMVRQWQQFFHDRRYSATPMSSPDYVKLADAHGLPGIRVTRRADVADALRHARAAAGSVVIDFRVDQEDTVYPMVSPGAALNDMIRRPGSISLAETGADV
jgi:acetolactate synthase-1/2/3 large subunit